MITGQLSNNTLLHSNGSQIVPSILPETTIPHNREMAFFIIRCVIPSLYLIIIMVGLLGNITLVKIFITNSAMRSVPNIFISSLAAGDLLLLVTCVPVDAFRFFFEEWILGEVCCKLIPSIQLTSVGVSVFTLTALSADRYEKCPRSRNSLAGGGNAAADFATVLDEDCFDCLTCGCQFFFFLCRGFEICELCHRYPNQMNGKQTKRFF